MFLERLRQSFFEDQKFIGSYTGFKEVAETNESVKEILDSAIKGTGSRLLVADRLRSLGYQFDPEEMDSHIDFYITNQRAAGGITVESVPEKMIR